MFGFRALGTHPGAHVFEFGADEPLAPPLRLFGDLLPEGAGFEVGGVVARMRKRFALRDLDDPRGNRLQKIPVVRDEDQRSRKALQKFLQPPDRFGVEVVGGLVEQEEVGLRGQRPAERDATLLAAGQRADHRVERWRGQCPRFRLDPRLQIPSGGMLDEVEQFGHLGLAPLARLVALHPAHEIRRARLDVLQNRPAPIKLEFLRQIPDPQPATTGNPAGIRFIFSGQNF